MEYLREFFDITVFYYNPNISSEPEYQKRLNEEKRLIEEFNHIHTKNTSQIKIIDGDYEPEKFYSMAKGLEKCPEGGERCFRCFELRLRKSFEVATLIGADYVTTTLTISPLKNAAKINEIGYSLENELCKLELCKLKWLPSDFKKKNGYKRSIELSREYDLYRQNFCGCVYSQVENQVVHKNDNMV